MLLLLALAPMLAAALPGESEEPEPVSFLVTTDLGTLPRIGLELEANESAFCGLEVIPGAFFADGTVITFGGTMTCPTAEDCATVETRDAEEGPEIVVDTPAGS